MDWDLIVEWLTGYFVLLSAFLTFAAGVGMLRFQDLFSRIHAGAKPQVLGIISMVIAVGLQNPEVATITMLVLIVIFQMLTQPMSAHMLSRTGYRSKHLKMQTLWVDELADDVSRVDRRARAERRAIEEITAAGLLDKRDDLNIPEK